MKRKMRINGKFSKKFEPKQKVYYASKRWNVCKDGAEYDESRHLHYKLHRGGHTALVRSDYLKTRAVA